MKNKRHQMFNKDSACFLQEKFICSQQMISMAAKYLYS